MYRDRRKGCQGTASVSGRGARMGGYRAEPVGYHVPFGLVPYGFSVPAGLVPFGVGVPAGLVPFGVGVPAVPVHRVGVSRVAWVRYMTGQACYLR